MQYWFTWRNRKVCQCVEYSSSSSKIFLLILKYIYSTLHYSTLLWIRIRSDFVSFFWLDQKILVLYCASAQILPFLAKSTKNYNNILCICSNFVFFWPDQQILQYFTVHPFRSCPFWPDQQILQYFTVHPFRFCLCWPDQQMFIQCNSYSISLRIRIPFRAF
jgi:hypothetical protein